jgi:hypothetical protein
LPPTKHFEIVTAEHRVSKRHSAAELAKPLEERIASNQKLGGTSGGRRTQC